MLTDQIKISQHEYEELKLQLKIAPILDLFKINRKKNF